MGYTRRKLIIRMIETSQTNQQLERELRMAIPQEENGRIENEGEVAVGASIAQTSATSDVGVGVGRVRARLV